MTTTTVGNSADCVTASAAMHAAAAQTVQIARIGQFPQEAARWRIDCTRNSPFSRMPVSASRWPT